MGPLVSILIPTFNRPELLLKTIYSALLQSYKNIEVIISDNSNNDLTEAVVSQISDSRLLYSKNIENIGLVPNWRKLLETSSGKYCLVISDDDYFINPFFIEDAVTIFLQYKVRLVIPDCIIGRQNINQIGKSGVVGLINGRSFLNGFWASTYFPSSVNLFEREDALKNNAFLSNNILYPDIELWLKILSSGDVYCYNIPSVFYLFHRDNLVMSMTMEALVKTSKLIRQTIGSYASEELIYELTCRYILFLDPIYNLTDYAFVKSIFVENGVKEEPTVLLTKVKYYRAKNIVKTSLKKLAKYYHV